MEHNGENAENTLPSTLCRTGCGFYASAAFEGMCSKCYKDSVKRRQQNSSPTPSCLGGRNSPGASIVSDSTGATSATGGTTVAVSNKTHAVSSTVDTSKTPDVETATPTVPSTSTTSTPGKDCEASNENKAEACTSASDMPSDRDKKPKKNRCHSCKKKVGLTGFPCRCGGLFCSMHRYSDKHDCSFNYKELGQEQIRKANPVVVGQKIQKI